MLIQFATSIRRTLRPALAAGTLLAVFALATPSANATLSIGFQATADSSTITGGSTGTANIASFSEPLTDVGNFSVSATSTARQIPATQKATLSTTTFALSNLGAGTDTVTISLSSTGYTIGVNQLVANFSTSGSSANYTSADTTTASSFFNPSGTLFAREDNLDPLTGTPITSGALAGTYTFTNGGNGPVYSVTRGTSPFGFTQDLMVTLGAGDSVTLTITTAATAVPEPSTMALAGLGALGLVGYGIRRRKARTA
jgi:hypothetical protein